MTPSGKVKRLERIEAHLARWVFLLASLYAVPALLIAAIVPTLDMGAWASSVKLDWSNLKVGGVVFSLAGFIALGATLTNATFAYSSNSKNPEIATFLRSAAKNLYTCLITMLAMIAVAFALNFYGLFFPDTGETSLSANLWDVIAIPGLLLMALCSALAVLKFRHFVTGVMRAIRLEADES